jgi:putative membrane protein
VRYPIKLAWLVGYLTGLVWSASNPHDYFTWFLEAIPALIGLAVLAATHKRFPLTRLTYTLPLATTRIGLKPI